MIHQQAELLAGEWASERLTVATQREISAVTHALLALADPTSDYGDLLDTLCRARWTSPVPLRVVEALLREHAGDGGPGCDGGEVPWVEGPAWDVAETVARELGTPVPGVSS